MEKDGRNSRDLQAIETKNKIYEVGMSLLREKGFESVSIAEICRKAGVSVGLFYYYFPSKTEILNEKFKRADAYFDKEIRDSLTGETSVERIVDYARRYLSFVEGDGVDFIRNLYHTRNTFFTQEGRGMQRLLRDLIAQGQEGGEVRSDISPEEGVRFVFTLLRGIVFDWALRNGEYQLVEGSSRHMDMLASYLSRLL